MLKHRFQKMLPELSGARSVAPQGQPFGAMSCLGVAFLEKSPDARRIPDYLLWGLPLALRSAVRLALPEKGPKSFYRPCLRSRRSLEMSLTSFRKGKPFRTGQRQIRAFFRRFGDF